MIRDNKLVAEIVVYLRVTWLKFPTINSIDAPELFSSYFIFSLRFSFSFSIQFALQLEQTLTECVTLKKFGFEILPECALNFQENSLWVSRFSFFSRSLRFFLSVVYFLISFYNYV